MAIHRQSEREGSLGTRRLPSGPTAIESEPKENRPAVSANDKKPLEEYGQAVARCGTGRVIQDAESGLWSPKSTRPVSPP